jgi:hypothetical protein
MGDFAFGGAANGLAATLLVWTAPVYHGSVAPMSPWRIGLAAALIGAFGCTAENEPENGFLDSRPEFMEEVALRLEAADIPFRTDAEGYVRYGPRHEPQVRRIRQQIESDMSGGIAWKIDEAASREYLATLLASMGRRSWVQPREDGVWVLWHPRSEQEKLEVQMKLVKHAFALRQRK